MLLGQGSVLNSKPVFNVTVPALDCGSGKVGDTDCIEKLGGKDHPRTGNAVSTTESRTGKEMFPKIRRDNLGCVDNGCLVSGTTQHPMKQQCLVFL